MVEKSLQAAAWMMAHRGTEEAARRPVGLLELTREW